MRVGLHGIADLVDVESPIDNTCTKGEADASSGNPNSLRRIG